jgi:nitroreductase
VHLEGGHAAQNVHLQAVALDLGTVVVGAFADAEVKRVLTLADNPGEWSERVA